MSEQTAFHNEGVGHGGFIANLSAAGNVIISNFAVESPSKDITQGNQIGAPRKQASVSDFVTATATAAIEVTEGTNPVTAPVIVKNGETFDADPFYGYNWYVSGVGTTFRDGEFWMQNLKLRRRYN